jgi:hypothetical protein
MAQIEINCPKCGKRLPPKFIYASAGRLSGSRRGPTKRKGSEEMSRIAHARWEKIRNEKTA